MKYIIEFIREYGLSLLHSIFLLIISYISLELKRIYKKHTNDLTKEKVINMVYHAIYQMYPNLTKEEKLNKIIINSQQILKEKGIIISNLELKIYIEYNNHLNLNKKESDLK